MKINIEDLIGNFIILWAVIDPIGTIPVYIAVTKKHSEEERRKIAKSSAIIAFFILLFFIIAGELLLHKVGVPLSAFQTSGGIILLLFALNMIFGDSKPEEEIQLLKKSQEETAVFPLAIPSIAGPGAILAVVLLTENEFTSIINQAVIILLMATIVLITYLCMRLSNRLLNLIGNTGAIVISKVMGLILASMAANYILIGIKEYFNI